MKFNKLRIVGFKSFVEATDFQIEPGLTGVVGPNGCGKSNLVEAMRWVMGESSYKNMRASGMDDVIFSGSGNRPARNMAEVGLVLDNTGRTAPAAFNDADLIEVTRKIERESGSTYRVNGREVRARDVQLLFADASTGARSPSMVRQGQIGEIISAKPQARRRILEEAAGVGGLHSRRHEAEMRLKGAEDNLLRLEDVLKQIESQSDSLKRQSRQAAKYRTLSADIRRNEALIALVAHKQARTFLAEAERKLEADVRDVAERTRAQAEAAKNQAIAAQHLPLLRDEEAKASAALQRLILAREALDGEERRAQERSVELERRITQLKSDLQRETALIDDAAGVLEKLHDEDAELADASEQNEARAYDARERVDTIEDALNASEKALSEAQIALADINARRNALEAAQRDESQRLARTEIELQKIVAELDTLRKSPGGDDEMALLSDALAEALGAAETAEEHVFGVEERLVAAREAETAAHGPLNEAERKAQRLETEVRTLRKILHSQSGSLWPPVVEDLSVAKGYEAALGAALGDDLDASTNPSAPAHWALTTESDDAALPLGVKPLVTLVDAPLSLHRRLSQIGVVLRTEGAQLRGLLKPGQRLVSKEGDLWRWDGFTQAAEAPTPAARRLAEKNRLGELTLEMEAARKLADAAKITMEAAQAAVKIASNAEAEARQNHRLALRKVEEVRERSSAADRKRVQIAARLSALEEAQIRLVVSRDESTDKRAQMQESLLSLDAPVELNARLETARARAAQDRAAMAEAKAQLQGLVREAETRSKRRAAIANELQSWAERRARATGQISEFDKRLAEAVDEQKKLAEAPDEFLAQRRALMSEIEGAETNRKAASDKRSSAEAELANADKQARAALDSMSGAREERARSEARLEAARSRLAEVIKLIVSELECEPPGLYALAQVKIDDPLPDLPKVERLVEDLKSERDRLGPVNLRAEDELAEVEKSRENMVAERDDLTEAIKRLRTAIQNLNKEGRERLLAAFEVVNGHFKELFTALFGGGTAELQLVESDDPLEAGLEILARPPGKKPQTMTLLSGGEQALTAMSLIFAVFLTNPSPICVLDEVDAPLDDANVERFCDLLDEMAKKTDTRFVTITHNPITMARMDRLFGVTMAERGVSQLVSVDLQHAERMLEAI